MNRVDDIGLSTKVEHLFVYQRKAANLRLYYTAVRHVVAQRLTLKEAMRGELCSKLCFPIN